MESHPKPLEVEIAAFEGARADLEATHMGKWVVFKGVTLEGTFDTFEMAAENAVRRFGREPFLLRQVGRPAFTLPASLAFRQFVEAER